MAGLLTRATYDRFNKAATDVDALMADKQQAVDLNGLGASFAEVDPTRSFDDTLPMSFDVSLYDEQGAAGVWVFANNNILDRFYDVSADVAAPVGAGANHIEYPLGAWCRAFGSRVNNSATVAVDLYFMADYSAGYTPVPFAFVLVAEGMQLTNLPTFVLALKVANISVTGEVKRMSMDGVSLAEPIAKADIVVGYGLRLTAKDIDTWIYHTLFSSVYDETVLPDPIVEKLRHNKDVRTFIRMSDNFVSAFPTSLNGPIGPYPEAKTVKNVNFQINTNSEASLSLQQYAALSNTWLSVAAVAGADGTSTRLTITGNALSGEMYVHTGFVNERPYKSFVMAEFGNLTIEFSANPVTTFFYQRGHIYANVANLSQLMLPLGSMTGYVVQLTAGATSAQFTEVAPGNPPAGEYYPSLRLTVTFAPVSYATMEKYDTFYLISAQQQRPTPSDPLEPEAIHMSVCTGDETPRDFNTDEVQTGMRIPMADKDSGELTGCALMLRYPRVPASDADHLGVTFVTDIGGDGMNRRFALKGVTATPAASTQERVYALSHTGVWGLVELEMLFQYDATNKRFYYNPQKYTDNGTQKLLDAAHPTDKFDFQWDSNTINGIKVKVLADVRINPTSGALEKSYRYLEFPKVLIAHVSQMTAYETVIEKQECT